MRPNIKTDIGISLYIFISLNYFVCTTVFEVAVASH